MRILIVEDNADAAHLLARVLSRDGHDALAVVSADEALAAAIAALARPAPTASAA